MFFFRITVCLFVTILLCTGISCAQNSILDSTFGEKGIVNKNLYYGSNFPSHGVVFPDGKIIVMDGILHRYDENGKIDSTFGKNGILKISSSGEGFSNMILDSSKKILAIGWSNINGKNEILIRRFLENGSVDSSYGVNGSALVDVERTNLSAPIIGNDGSLIIAGNLSGSNPFIIKLLSNGSLDYSWGNQGILNLFIPLIREPVILKLAEQRNGQLILALTYVDGQQSNYSLYRLKLDGSYDSAFGFDGSVELGEILNGYVYSLNCLRSDKILVSFNIVDNYSNVQYRIMQFDSSGIVDWSFGTNGIIQPSAEETNVLYNLLIRPDESCVISTILETSDSIFHLTENFISYNSNGALNNLFGKAGIFTLNSNILSFELGAGGTLLNAPDNKIVGIGYFYLPSRSDIGLIRLTNSGNLDSTFGLNGEVDQPYGTSWDYLDKIQLMPDSNIFVCGDYYNAVGFDYALVKLNFQGVFNPTSSNNGIYIHVPNDAEIYDYARTLFQLPDGKIQITGIHEDDHYLTGTRYSFFVHQFLPDLITDSTYGIKGRAEYWLPYIYTLDADRFNSGKIAFLGSNGLTATTINNFIYRLNIDGTIDSVFGTNGLKQYTFPVDSFYFYRIHTTKNDEMLLDAIDNRNGRIALLLKNDGSIDPNYGINGYAYSPPTGRPWSVMFNSYLQEDGKLLLLGQSDKDADFYVIRINERGFPDSSFNNTGIFKEATDSERYTMWSITSTPDEKHYYMTGTYYKNPFTNHLVVFALNSKGQPDSSFGINGAVILPLVGKEVGKDIKVMVDGSLLVGADGINLYDSSQYNEHNILLVKMLTDVRFVTANSSFNKPNEFLVYPQPLHDHVNVTFELKHDQNVNFILYDAQGKISNQWNYLKGHIGGNSTYLNIPTNLARGWYVLQIQAGNLVQSIKVIIQ